MDPREELEACRARLAELQVRYEQLEAELRSANEFRSLFLTAIAHDLRTPLTAILGFTALVKRDGASEDARHAAAEQIEFAAATLRARVEDLLAVAAIDFEGVPTAPFDVRPVAVAAVDGVDASVDMPAGPCMALGDEDGARRVLRHMVEVCAHLARDGKVQVRVRPDGDEICSTVSEPTSAFSTEELETLFERFLGLPGWASAPESGVGLYVAKRLAEAQGGSLLVVPGDPKGVTLLFTLPAAARFAPAEPLR